MKIKMLFCTLLAITILLGVSVNSYPIVNQLPKQTNIYKTVINKLIHQFFSRDDQAVWGFIYYSDGSPVPIGVVVTLTNLNNNNSMTTLTVESLTGKSNYYWVDIFTINGTEDGDIIQANVSYGGSTGISENLTIDISLPSQRLDVTIYGNLPPGVPSQPSGPTFGYINSTYYYLTSTGDFNGDDIYYWLNWGDGTNSGWIGPYNSNETCNASHLWVEAGTYSIKAKAKDEYGAERGHNVTSSEWSDPLNITMSLPNSPPNIPSNPDPYDGETDVDVDHDLSWTGGDPDGDNVTYDVYFGTSSPPPIVENNQSSNIYDPGTMDGNTQYFWEIIAWDNHSAYSEGPIWDFTTENNPPNTPSDPDPDDGATDIDINADLSWSCSDPDGDDLSYNVYFEANDPTPDELVSENQTDTNYDPGTMDYDTHYYWKIVAWDEYGASTSGSVWDFTTGLEPNDPPYVPSDPHPENGSIDIDNEADLSWTGGDPDEGDTVVYDVYLEANNPNPDTKVADDISETTFDPGSLEYETVYYWRVVAIDNHYASTWGPIWHFTTEAAPVPDLNCYGSLSWIGVQSGDTITGSFNLENTGESNSLLDWEVIDWPDWGTWNFEPVDGEDLTPEDGTVMVNVTIIAPDQQNQDFSGEVKIVNKDNISDNCTIPVYLSTSKNKLLIFNYKILENLLKQFHELSFTLLFFKFLKIQLYIK